MVTDGIATLLDFGLDRAFPNLYHIEFPIVPGTLIDMSTSMKYYAEKLDFGGDFTIDTEYSEATKQFFIKNAQRIKTATITFRETSQYKVVNFIRSWMESLYDFVNNTFNDFNPEGVITVNLEQTRTPGIITLSGAYPTLLKYPSFDWADGNPIKIPCTFSFKDIAFIFP